MGESATSEVRAKYKSVRNLIENATADGERAAAAAAAERMRARYDGLDSAGGNGSEPSQSNSDFWSGFGSHDSSATGGVWFWDSAAARRGEYSSRSPDCDCPACQAEARGERETVRTVSFDVGGLRVNLQVAYRDGRAVRVVGFENDDCAE